MSYGELSTYPLEIRVKLGMVSFWTKLVQSETKLSCIIYRFIKANHDFKWISCVMPIFDNTGLSYIFANQLNINMHSL